jgi:hypothetical protein
MGALEAFSEHQLAGEIEGALADLEPRRFEVRLFVDGRRTYRVSVEPYDIGGVREALMFLTDASEGRGRTLSPAAWFPRPHPAGTGCHQTCV